MIRQAIFFVVLSAPAAAYASSGGEPTTTSIILQCVNLAVNAFVTSRIAPLEKRVKALEDSH